MKLPNVPERFQPSFFSECKELKENGEFLEKSMQNSRKSGTFSILISIAPRALTTQNTVIENI